MFYDTNRLSDPLLFSYTVESDGVNLKVVLTRVTDGAVKVFNIVNKSSVDNMKRHMNSLTDGQLEQMFPKERVKK